MTLPPKEANLFKLTVKSYETKQYKKGVKAADAILKKFPDHGETLSMKGLILNCMDKKTEAYELVKKGLKSDLKSHVCWHVYGLLYRSDREYREAIKCYRNALRIDSENIQILRDLSLLQAQMRDFTGFVETRRQLLALKSNHRNNWIGFAIAHHCSGNPSMAIQILEAYEGTLEENFPPPNEKYEHGEMLLYKVMLFEESGDLNKAYQELIKNEKLIVDKIGFKEEKAKLLLKLKRLGEAKHAYYSLLSINPDNYNYYFAFQSCLGLSKSENGTYNDEKIKLLNDLYLDLKSKFPFSSAVKRIPLDFLNGENFEIALKNYVKPFLRKGVPSVFSDLKSLYSQPGKAKIINKVFKELEENLKKYESLDPSSEIKDNPSSYVWLYFLLAQHYDKLCQHELALEMINKAINHTPTIADLYLFKGRIFKHSGDPEAAAASANEARGLDLADRFLNSETVKRMLQADHISEAEKTATLFTKDGDQHDNLFEMQCMWYEICSGDSHFRQGSYGKALKKYLSVFKHYNDIIEDQFDFHTYCLRKMTLRAYISMLRFEDDLHSHPFFCKSAFGIIRSYLAIYDSPPKSSLQNSSELSNLTPSERKRLKQKQKKEEARKKEEAETLKEEAAQKAKKGLNPKPVDEDPNGEKLASVDDPLSETIKHITLLQQHASKLMETHVLAFEVYYRKKKWILTLQSLKRMMALDSSHHDFHRCLIRFFYAIKSETFGSDSRGRLLTCVIETETKEMCTNNSEEGLIKKNEQFLQSHSNSLVHRAAAAEMLLFISPQQKMNAIQIIELSKEKKMQSDDVFPGTLLWKLNDCVSVHRLLLNTFKENNAAERWKKRCSELFPRSNYFAGRLSSAVCGIEKREEMNELVAEFEDFQVSASDAAERAIDSSLEQQNANGNGNGNGNKI